MINISALLPDLSISQNSFYLIKEFNKCLSDTDLSMGVFHLRAALPPIQPLFSCKNVAFLNSYNGVIVSTRIEEANITLKSYCKTDRYLYLWDLDWLENPVHFSTAMETMRDPKLKLIARSESHAEVIKNFCNREVCGIVDNWSMGQLLVIVK